MTSRYKIIRKVALVCLLQAINITVSAACSQYRDVNIDHTKRPSGTSKVFSFTRKNKIRDHDLEVLFSETEFTRLLRCFLGHSDAGLQDLVTCKFTVKYMALTSDNLYRLYNAHVDSSVSNEDSPSTTEYNQQHYACVLPDQFFDFQVNSVNCTKQTLPNRCFKYTDNCITLNPKDTELQSYVHVIFRSEGEISVQYNSNIVVVDYCNPSTTTTGYISPSNGITTKTTASPNVATTTTTIASPDGKTNRTTASPGRETTGTAIHPAPETTANSSASDEETDNIGLIIGAVCGSFLLIALIVIGVLCWKRPVVIWKRGRKLSTDPTQTGVSTSNVSQPSADNLIYHDEEIYPSSEAKHHTLSSISTSDYASLDSENLDTLEAPMKNKGIIKDVYASVHQSRKRGKRQQQHENSKDQTDHNSDTLENTQEKRQSIKDVYTLIRKSRKHAKRKQQPETNNNKNTDQNSQTEHDDAPSTDDETFATNDVKNGDKKKSNKYSKLHEINVNTLNPYDDLLEPNEYHDATSAEATTDLTNEETDCNVIVKPDTKLKTKPVIPSKPKFLTKPGN